MTEDDGWVEAGEARTAGDEEHRVEDVQRQPAHGKEHDDSTEPLDSTELLHEDLPTGRRHRLHGNLQTVDLLELSEDNLEDEAVEEEHDEEGQEDTAEEVEVDHVVHVNHRHEGTLCEWHHRLVPTEHWDETDQYGGEPGECDDSGRDGSSAVGVVDERELNGDESLNRDREETKYGDLSEDDNDSVGQQTPVEFSWQTVLGDDCTRDAQESHQEVRHRQTRNEVVGERLKLRLPGDHK